MYSSFVLESDPFVITEAPQIYFDFNSSLFYYSSILLTWRIYDYKLSKNKVWVVMPGWQIFNWFLMLFADGYYELDKMTKIWLFLWISLKTHQFA